MKRPLVSGLIIAVVHAAIVLSLGVQAAIGRDRLPRAWARAAEDGPGNRVHGRYLTFNLVPVTDPGLAPRLDVIDKRTVVRPTPIALEARDGRLLAHRAAASRADLVRAKASEDATAIIAERIDLFLPPGTPDPMPLLRDGELWVEVSVPEQGAPRPLRLGKMKDGKIEPLGEAR